MVAVRVAIVLLAAAGLAQGQGRQRQRPQGLQGLQGRQQGQIQEQQPEGRSLVDWYFFDASNVDAPQGRVVSVPPAAHHRSFGGFPQQGVKTAFSSNDRSDRGGCFHRGTASAGACAAVSDCAYAARQLQHWGTAEMCDDGVHVCCPGMTADAGDAFPSPSWDPYTFQYYPAPSCGHGHAHHDHHHEHFHEQHFNPAPPAHQVPDGGVPPEFAYFEGLYPDEVSHEQPMPAPAMPAHPMPSPVAPAPAAPMPAPAMPAPAMPAPMPALMPAPIRPGLPPVHLAPDVQPVESVEEPPMESPMEAPMAPPMAPPAEAPAEPLVPLIEDGKDKQPGDVARMKCVEYEKYAPTVRFGPDKDCIPNHTYPIGGNPALPREFPHFAQVGFGARGDIQWFCGGALIAPSWVVTAAHCLYSGSRKVQWVRLGDLEPESDEDDSNPQIIAVAQAVRHPDYKVPQVYNDIALLRLAREPDMSTPHVRPACLQVDTKLKKDKLNLIGFGLTEENGDPAKVLMEVALWRTPGDKCKDFFEGPINLRQLPDGLRDDSQLCAGLDQVGKDACQGDSGGPLNTPYSPTCMHSIPGITSFGQGCGRGAPGVYTRVSHFVPWIERIVWPEEFK